MVSCGWTRWVWDEIAIPIPPVFDRPAIVNNNKVVAVVPQPGGDKGICRFANDRLIDGLSERIP